MPGKVKVKVLAGRHLPVMDRSNDTTDAYVEVKLGSTVCKTDVCRKSLNPQWNSEWFKFEMDDLELQDEPLQIRLMDYDTYSANDAIGKVHIDLNPLLTNPSKTKEPSGRSMSGWIPIYDTMHGIRGEVNLMVKVELFSDLNKFRQSSCGVKFFFTQAIPEGHMAIQLHGFVEELVVNDDPEYQWIDKIRTPRASNEARQLLFLKLAGEVQRRVGLKALELGGNAVIGYRVCFDLEGESGIVVRGIGTAATLTKIFETALENPTGKEFLSVGHHLLGHPLFPKSDSKLSLISISPKTSPLKNTDVYERVACCIGNSNSNRNACSNEIVLPNDTCVLLHDAEPTLELPIDSTTGLKPTFKVSFPTNGDTLPDEDISLVPSPIRSKQSIYEGLSPTFQSENTSVKVSSPVLDSRNQLSPLSEARSSFAVEGSTETQFAVQRKRRASKKRDKYSTSALVKRVSDVNYEKKEEPSTGFSIRNEFINFFRRRRRFMSGDSESSRERDVENVKTGIYRKSRLEKQFFFCSKKQRKFSRTSSSLRRSSSESFSIERISIESLPSLKSEDVGLEFDWSQIKVPTPEELNLSSPKILNPLFNDRVPEKPKPFDAETMLPPEGRRVSISSPNLLSHDKLETIPTSSTLMQAINDLGYTRSDKPLRLYISSLDALLVCAPSKECNSACPITESRTSNNLVSITSDNNCSNLGTYSGAPACETSEADKATRSRISDQPSQDLSLQQSTNFTGASTNSVQENVSFLSSDTTNYARTRDAVSSSGVVPDENIPQPQINLGTLKTAIEQISSAGEASDQPAETPGTKVTETTKATSQQNQISSSQVVHTSEVKPAIGGKSGNKPERGQVQSKAVITSRSEVFASKPGPSSALKEVASSPSTHVTHTRNGSTGTPAHHSRTNTVSQSKASAMPPIAGRSGSISARRSSEADLSTPPTGLLNSTIEAIITHNKAIAAKRLASGTDHFDLLEYPFVTIGQLPPRFIQRIGGAVSARSVKLLERISNLEEPESRDSWWTEIRMEIRSHARSICCNVILGYDEQTTICDDVCILSATGTAALVNSSALSEMVDKVVEVEKSDSNKDIKEKREKPPLVRTDTVIQNGVKTRHTSAEDTDPCTLCHLPYNESFVPFPVKMARCQICKKGRVPDLLLATIGIPQGLPICGKMSLIQSHVFRVKKDAKGEASAKEVSDSVPFLEYELHRRLINKLKVRGMNSIFCLQVQICLGENLMVGVATGTAVCLVGLPPPQVPKITGGNLKADTQKVNQFQKVVQDTYDRNREFYRVASVPGQNQASNGNGHQSTEEEGTEEEPPDVDLATGNKDAYVLEVDDAEDIDIISDLVDPSPPSAFEMNNLDSIIGYDDFRVISQQMFAQIWSCHVPNISLRQLAGYFDRLMRSISFKLRAMKPCVLNKLRFRVELPEPDEIQISIVGTAVGMVKRVKTNAQDSPPPPTSKKSIADAEMIFNLEYEGMSGQRKYSGHTAQSTVPKRAVSMDDTSSNEAPTNLPSMSAEATSSPGGDLTNAQDTNASPTMRILSTNEGSGYSLQGSSGRASTVPSLLTPNMTCSPQIAPLPLVPRSVVIPNLKRTITKCSIPGPGKGKYVIEITTLSSIPGYRIEKYLGNLNCFFIRETTSVKEMGGPSGFVHNFIVEVLAIIRAHVAALGGNALVSYFMAELSLLHNPHKNQGQCLINVGGDVVFVVPANSINEEEIQMEGS